MSNAKPVTIKGVGDVELPGVGPWRVRACGGSHDIVDSTGAVTNPTVWNTTGGANTVRKASASVVFSKRADAELVVDTFNKALAK